MWRVFTVLVSTMLYAIFGLVVGHLSVVAQQSAARNARGDDLMAGYLVAPVLAGTFGLILSVLTVRFLGPRH